MARIEGSAQLSHVDDRAMLRVCNCPGYVFRPLVLLVWRYGLPELGGCEMEQLGELLERDE